MSPDQDSSPLGISRNDITRTVHRDVGLIALGVREKVEIALRTASFSGVPYTRGTATRFTVSRR